MTKILLIEDNGDHAELIQRSLQKGFGRVKLQVVETAQDAYYALKRKDFDLILSDYYLPGVNGDDHIKELNERAPSVPIVIITGQGDEKIAAKSIQSGAEDYIVKTREALDILSTILKRSIVKHRSHRSKRQKELRLHLDHQKESVKQVLGEVEAIDRKMKHLKKLKSRKAASPVNTEGSTLEHLTQRIESLKKLVKKMFFRK